MEQFCRALHPDLGLSPTCLSWFRQATEHCTGIILHSRPGSQFWNTVKSFIFPERQTGLLNQNIPISIHPNRLSMHDCHSLFLDIVNDYVLRAPRYSAESATNALLWQILFSLMGIMALGSLLVSTIFGYRKFGRMLRRLEHEDVVFAPAQRARAYVNHNMRVVQHELRRLRVQHVVQPEELFAPDGTATLVLRLSTKLNFLDQIVTSQENAMGRLYRLHELMGKKNAIKPDFKVETINKALKFLNSYKRKLRVIFVFDDEPLYEQHTRKRKNRSPPKHSPPKLSAVSSVTSANSRNQSSFSFQSRTSTSRTSTCAGTPRSTTPRPTTPRPTTPSPGTPRLATPRACSPVKARLSSPRLRTMIPRNFVRRSTNIIMKK